MAAPGGRSTTRMMLPVGRMTSTPLGNSAGALLSHGTASVQNTSEKRVGMFGGEYDATWVSVSIIDLPALVCPVTTRRTGAKVYSEADMIQMLLVVGVLNFLLVQRAVYKRYEVWTYCISLSWSYSDPDGTICGASTSIASLVMRRPLCQAQISGSCAICDEMARTNHFAPTIAYAS